MKVKEILQDCSEWMPGTDYDTVKPVVSVLLPTFRRAKSGLFEAAVRSVLNQDFKSLELIIIDDASTDGTADLIRHFMQADPRVSCIRHRFNVGLPAISEFEGYMKARGEYIAFIFDDNEWERDFIGKTIPYMIRNQAKASYGIVRSYYNEDQFLELGKSEDGAGVGIQTLCCSNYIPNGAVILTREAIETVGLYDPHVALTRICDWNLWKRMAAFYELLETGILAGVERGVSQEDSLGNSYKMDQWVAAERECFQDEEMLKPAHFEEIEINYVSAHNSRMYIDGVAELYHSFAKKKWFHPQRIEQENLGDHSVLHIVVLAAYYDASLTLSFVRLSRVVKGLVIRFGTNNTSNLPIYEISQADAVILVRNIVALNPYKKICEKIGIPCFLYMDDNFIELSKENKKDTFLKNMRSLLEKGYAEPLEGVITSTIELKDYCKQKMLNPHISLLEPCIDKVRVQEYRALGSEDPVTVAYMGGTFRDRMFQDIVMSAIACVAQHQKVRVLYPSRINLSQFEKRKDLELIPIDFSLSLDLCLCRFGRYHPQFLLHCGPDIKNNIYKTENALINAVQLGAVLVCSDVMPFKKNAKEHGYCACAKNTVDDWCAKLDELIADQQRTGEIYEAATQYCMTRYTRERACNALKQILKDIKPTPYYEILRRMRETFFDELYVHTMTDTSIGTVDHRPMRSLTEVPLSFTGGLAKSKTYYITCRVQTFSELGICFSSFGEAHGTIRISINCAKGQLRECVLDMDDYVHDGWTYLEFEPIEGAAGQVYMVKLNFEYGADSALVGVFEDATKRTLFYRLQNKLGFSSTKQDVLFVDCR